MRGRARVFLGAGLVLFLLLPAVLASAAEKGKAGKVDINSASQSELESLPGVGPALAKRIIENRPYSSASGLSKAGVPEATIDKLRGLVKAGRGSGAEAKEAKAAAKAEKKADAEKRESRAAESRSEKKATPEKTLPSGEKIDINTASAAELESLPGVGAATARKIMENRPYSSVADLSRAGVPDSTIDRIRGMVRTSRAARAAEKAPERAAESPVSREPAARQEKGTSAGPVDLNTASESDLEALPGIGPVLAKRIVENRPYASVADLSKAGVPAPTIERVRSMVRVSAPRSARASESRSEPSVPYQAPPSRGMVWVNLDTRVFHREGDRWYGRTVHGKYMTEAEAVRSGARVSHEKGEPEKP